MNKIYNNLSIENLTKTEWFNQFNKKQMREIREGLKANLDVSLYNKKKFSPNKMKEIILGLKSNVDVLIYAKSFFDAEQMKKIREKLLKKSTL